MTDVTRNVTHVTQGEFHITGTPRDVLTTILGSCVAVCLRDPVRRLGGMNHFLLPGSDPASGQNVKYGAHLMERLINALLRAGANRNRFEAYVYGGANVVQGLGNIGESNAIFARDFIRNEGFVLRGADTGGTSGRRLYFHPSTGSVRVEILEPSGADVQQGERRRRRAALPSGSVELF